VRIGTLAYATEQGLGRLAKSFADALQLEVMVVPHPKHPEQPWYPGAPHYSPRSARLFCRSMDAVLFFETPFDWSLLSCCRRSVLMLMHECTPRSMPAEPTAMLAPSLLELREFPGSKLCPVPVDVPWRLRTRVRTYVHNAGHGSFRGRNGTQEVLQALKHTSKPFKLLLRSQHPLSCSDPRAEVRCSTAPYSTLWDEGDAFVFPEKFNGLSLPLQEARAAGMLVLATDRFPTNTWLPQPLIAPRGYQRASIGGCYRPFEEAVVDSRDVAAAMDKSFDADIASYSLAGREWAEANSWEKLRETVLEAVCG
jgi:hypothetical protein